MEGQKWKRDGVESPATSARACGARLAHLPTKEASIDSHAKGRSHKRTVGNSRDETVATVRFFFNECKSPANNNYLADDN